MKNKSIIIILLFFLLLISQLGYSQIELLGMQIGRNMLSPSLKTMNDNNMTINSVKPFNPYTFGVHVEIKIIKGFGILHGLFFSNPGFMADATTKGPLPDFEEFNISLYYLDMPLYLQYKFLKGKFRIVVRTGPVISFGLGGKYTYSSQSDVASIKIHMGKGKDLPLCNYGISAGLGVEIIKLIQINVNYKYSLTNQLISPFELRSNGLYLGFCFLFKEKKQKVEIDTL